MKIAILVGVKTDDSLEVIGLSRDIDNLKKKQKELKLNEKKLNYNKTLLYKYPLKTFSMKPELKEKVKIKKS